MAEEAPQVEPDEPQGEPDYKALYEAEKAHSRKWEKQAKANKQAAEELEKSREAGKTAEERIASLESKLEAKEKAEARNALVAKVAEAKGVPARFLVGDTEEELNEYADSLLKHFKTKPAPKVEKPGSFDKGGKTGDAKSDFTEFMKEVFE